MSKKKLNKTVWYGSDVDLQGNAILPPLAEGREDLNGIHEGEIYLHNQDDDPGIWVRTDKGNIKRIGFNKQDLDLSEYLKKQVWDTAWELRTTEEGESYIFCKLPFISQYGITLYADGGNIDLPSLYAGIPVDGTTITKREDGTLMLNPTLELGGLDEEALQKYLDDYNYAKKSDIPSLEGYAKLTDVDNRINDLVNGAPAAYDTLKEIADVLQGNVNSIGDIITTLGTKADKTYVDTELAKYIPIAGDTEVTGVKDYLNGLKVGGLPISKYEGHDDVIYIDANVVLRGGLTQYAVDPVTIPSIIESLPQAGYESKGVASFSSDFFAIDANGKVSIIPDSVGLNEEELEEWLADSDYATKTYADETFATKSSLNATNTEVAKKWTQDNDKIANWDTAYGWGNHASAGYFLASNFTKANIVAKLGISDWALAATKPSYTTKEVTEDTNLYFTNQRAIDALADTLKAYVTLKDTQTIEGEKNFTGGLKVNGSPIVYDSENGYWLLQGNLLITGGLTQYVDDGSVDLPNLYDGLPIDNQTIYWDNGVLKAKVAEGGITSITKNMVVEALGFTPYDASNPNEYITSAALNGYLPLSGGGLTGNLALKSASASADTPKLYFQRGTTADTYYDDYIYNTSGGLTFGYSSGGIDYDLVKVTSTTLRPNSNNTYDLGSSGYKWANVYTTLINGGTPWHSGNFTPSNYLLASGYTAADVLAKLKTVDGAGSGLDADTLDGVQLSELFTGLSSSVDTNLSITVGGVTKSISNLYAYRTSIFKRTAHASADNTYDLNDHIEGMAYSYSSSSALINSPSGMSYGQVLALNSSSGKSLCGQLAWDINHASTTDVSRQLWWRAADSTNGFTYSNWHQIAFTDSNVASATKLQTARKIWGQSFDGTGDVNGIMYLQTGSVITYYDENAKANREFIRPPSGVSGGKNLIIGRYNADYDYALSLCGKSMVMYTGSWGSASMFIDSSGNVGIGTTSPRGKLHVEGNSYLRGTIYVTDPDATTINESSGKIKFNSMNPDDDYRSPYIQAIYYGSYSRKRLGIFQSNATNYTDDFVEVLSIIPNGNIGINQTSPGYRLDVTGTTRITGAVTLGSTLTGNYWYLNNSSTNPYLRLTRSSVNWYVQLVAAGLQLGQGSANSCTIDASGNFLSVGGITQYSDIRKKTKLNDVELTLSQVANAPLIEHYYNSDDKKTTHVGSIAQYWAGLNDWFCKLDSDGFYTMEIQNAALASAISVARELERYESKTDKKIRMLKKRINELEDEIKKLKNVA